MLVERAAARSWLLSCGHSAPMLEHETGGELPRRPRMCSTCGRLRQVEAPVVPAGELACVECGTRGRRGFRAAWAPDDEQPDEPPQLAVLCSECWTREFADGE